MDALILDDPRAPAIAPERILYAQCWEDADVLLEGLDVRPGSTLLSVASAGDNTLALLTRDPARVIAVDVCAAQLACLELRVAAYAALEHGELLELMGSRPSRRRKELYAKCRAHLRSVETRRFWDARQAAIAAHGLGGVGRFERGFRLFRRLVLPAVHRRATVRGLLTPKPRAAREAFYEQRWNDWRWRALVHCFFSRRVMAWTGREPAFFAHAEGSLAEQVLHRSRHALVELDPSANPYLCWILTGGHGSALPLSLRADHVPVIRDRLDRLEWHRCSVEEYAAQAESRGERIDGFNLSDVLEYVSAADHAAALRRLLRAAAPGARLLYWNMLVPRAAPPELLDRLAPLAELAADLHGRDKAFFYRRLCIEEVR